MSKSNRAFELDALRGLAIFMMICHHLIWDIRYLLGYDLFEFQEGDFFNYVLQPFFLCCFILISGICCTFSRNNLKRSLRMLIGSVAISVIMALVSYALLAVGVISDLHEEGLFVFFNILHLLTVGTFICWVIEKLEMNAGKNLVTGDKKSVYYSSLINSGLIIAALCVFMAEPLIRILRNDLNTYAFLPLGILPKDAISMGDYLPMIPWLGVYLIGISVGRTLYINRETAFPNTPQIIRALSRPLEFIGRHSLFVYLIHQPIILAILFGGRYSGIW
ncbi:MAG: DUF1624 domain-containing protein [Clostridiales bacterium]|nr:DUF1624 domain-containing protein [Clostridiales bacterium]